MQHCRRCLHVGLLCIYKRGICQWAIKYISTFHCLVFCLYHSGSTLVYFQGVYLIVKNGQCCRYFDNWPPYWKLHPGLCSLINVNVFNSGNSTFSKSIFLFPLRTNYEYERNTHCRWLFGSNYHKRTYIYIYISKSVKTQIYLCMHLTLCIPWVCALISQSRTTVIVLWTHKGVVKDLALNAQLYLMWCDSVGILLYQWIWNKGPQTICHGKCLHGESLLSAYI